MVASEKERVEKKRSFYMTGVVRMYTWDIVANGVGCTYRCDVCASAWIDFPGNVCENSSKC